MIALGVIFLILGMAQFFYYLDLSGKLYVGEIRSKKEFLVRLIPGKFLIDIYRVLRRCYKIFRSLP
jgi:hypothetical protein